MKLDRRRAIQAERLTSQLGQRGALEALNAIDQIGIEKPEDRCDVVDALIASIDRGQAWATGQTAIEISVCPACDGAKHSRSRRGRCRACRGYGRVQVRCRDCAELDARTRMTTTCPACKSSGQLDPVDDREKILGQHRLWWERMTKMRQEEPTTTMHEEPPPRRAAARGVVARLHGAITMYWDEALGSEDGIGTLERPYATLAQAEEAANAAQTVASMSPELVAALSSDDDDAPLPPTSPMPRAIAAALFEAQGAIQSVPKNFDNEGDGYSYTSAESIIAEARKALHGAGLCVTVHRWWKSAPDELMVAWLYIHRSGEQHITEPVPMPIVTDSREKRAADKGLATALTYCESQWLRIALQIPRIGRAEDADARADVGDGGRRARAKQQKVDETPLSTELNDTVLALTEAIDNAKELKAFIGIQKRLEEAMKKGLPDVVSERIRARMAKREEEIAPSREAKS